MDIAGVGEYVEQPPIPRPDGGSPGLEEMVRKQRPGRPESVGELRLTGSRHELPEPNTLFVGAFPATPQTSGHDANCPSARDPLPPPSRAVGVVRAAAGCDP